ncbi:SdiA-regulated domain-containing protein [Gramella sp. GC03-9]|uniref:SdiA-regulated domain-containing protein n=1 Tax=Christiangramia oceanisediminis TaxID=2920386 RepID=A0A9X2KYH1_9FLAO|nr:SdiA-regulated domain-containing protein [Gramella oceanisediminis]MCP9200371.1 SdiA-regulated domain-containing protein [Gramella oceanisediminis]
MTKWAVGIIIAVLTLVGLVYYLHKENSYDFDESMKEYEIVQKWNLPNPLDEISGMVWMGNDRIACIQDEDGIIFIFDLNTSEIVAEYKFGGPGDYEGLTLLNDELWVAESNGKLFRVRDLNDPEKTQEFQTGFEYKNNIEGIAATEEGNILILPKDRNLNSTGDGLHDAIYLYDPVEDKLNKEPYLTINYDDEAFKVLPVTEPEDLIRPSDLKIHPNSGDIYVLGAQIPKLLILDNEGKIKKIYLLKPREFYQPEGICFSPSGRIFISNEAKGTDASILEVKLN